MPDQDAILNISTTIEPSQTQGILAGGQDLNSGIVYPENDYYGGGEGFSGGADFAGGGIGIEYPDAVDTSTTASGRKRSADVAERERLRTEAARARAQGAADVAAAQTQAAQARRDQVLLRNQQIQSRIDNAAARASRSQPASPYQFPANDLNLNTATFEYGQKASFDTVGGGTPFEGSRYEGESLNFLPSDSSPSSFGTGMAPLSPEDDLSPYSKAQRQVSDITEDLRNSYTESGRFSEIGGKSFASDLNENLVSSGLRQAAAEPEKLTGWAGIKEKFAEEAKSPWGGLNYAFAAGTLAMGAAHAYQTENSGQYVSPEQQESANAAVLPGIGALLGTAIGTVTPLGAWGGGLVGGAVGQLGQGVLGSELERGQLSREGAESLTTSSSSAASGIRELADAINSLGAPVAVVKQAIGSIVSVGQAGTANATNLGTLGAMTNALGEYAAGDYASTAKYLRDPGMFPLAQEMGKNYALDASGYASEGSQAILGNDPQGLDEAKRDMAAANNIANPDYVAAKQRGVDDRNPVNLLKTFMHAPGLVGGVAAGIQYWLGGRNDANAADIAAKNPADPEIAQLDQYDTSYRTAAYNSALDESTLTMAQGGVSEARLGGLTGSGLSGANAGLYASLDKSGADEAARGSVIQSMVNDPRLVGAKVANQRALNQSLSTQQGYRLQELTSRRNTVMEDLDNAQSEFTNQNMKDTLAGISNEDQAAGDTAYYAERGRSARTLPYLTDSQRNQIESDALEGAHQVQQGVFSERLDKVNTFLSGAGVSVAQANATGGAQDRFAAAGQEIDGLRQRFAELTSELQKGGQTAADYRREQQELNQTQAQVIQATQQQRQAYFADLESVDNSGQRTARAGMGRNVLLQGSSAYAPAIAADQNSLNTLQRDLANEPNPTRRAEISARIAETQAGLANDTTGRQTYAQNISEQTGDLRARTAYDLAHANPFAGGPDSNPFTANAGLITQYEGDLSRRRAFDKTTNDPIAKFANEQAESGLQVQIAQLQQEKFSAAALALPEMIAGGQGMSAGVHSALVAPGAVSALMSPGPLNGSWGGGGGGVNSLVGGLGGQDSSKEVVGVLSKILEVLSRRGTPNQTAPFDQTAAHAEHQRTGYNTYQQAGR